MCHPKIVQLKFIWETFLVVCQESCSTDGQEGEELLIMNTARKILFRLQECR